MKQKTYVPLVKILLALVLSCGIAASAVGRPRIEEWFPSNGAGRPCLAGKICAEWVSEYGWRSICCIPPSYIGSNDPNACYALLDGPDPRDEVP